LNKLLLVCSAITVKWFRPRFPYYADYRRYYYYRAAAGISIALHLQQWYGIQEALPVVKFICGLTVYFITWQYCWRLPGGSPDCRLQRKVDGNIESLMATPLGPKALWLANALPFSFPFCNFDRFGNYSTLDG
jgi:hypothetical protein